MAAAVTTNSPRVGEEKSTFRWLRTGDEALESMLEAIEHARDTIRLETYIYRVGATGERFLDALVRACERGVKVHVLVDALGSFSLPDTFWTPLREAGAQCLWFNPIHL